MSDLVERLNDPVWEEHTGQSLVLSPQYTKRDMKEAAKEIIRLRKIVDALTVKLNKVLNERYIAEELLKERLDKCEHVMARLNARVEQLRYAREPQ